VTEPDRVPVDTAPPVLSEQASIATTVRRKAALAPASTPEIHDSIPRSLKPAGRRLEMRSSARP
jgi:hypothetical protein